MSPTCDMHLVLITVALVSGLINCQRCQKRDIVKLQKEITTLGNKIVTLNTKIEDEISVELSADIHDVVAELDKMSVEITDVKNEAGKLANGISELESKIEELLKISGEDKKMFELKVMDRLSRLDTKLNMMAENEDCLQTRDVLLRGGGHIAPYCQDGWMTIANRFNGEETFNYRTWSLDAYKFGLGSEYGEYFIGFERVLSILKRGNYMLRFDLVGWDNTHEHAEYSSFRIAKAHDNYRLFVSGFNSTGTSTIRDSFSNSNNQLFQAIIGGNCSARERSAWWYVVDSDDCGDSNLFTVYPNGPSCDIDWGCMYWIGFPGSPYLKEMTMKIKKSN